MGSSVGRNSSPSQVMTWELRSQYHLFRYASEWDPREKGKTKGGYLEGRINLPRVREDMRVVVSTCPAPGSELEGAEDVHPTLLHVVRKSRNRRMNEREPVPNIHHWRQEFLVINNKVTVLNKVSNRDEDRNVPDEDELFELNDERVITFGKDVGDVNMIILIPKTDARAHGKDVTVSDLLRSRIKEKYMKNIEKHYKGKNSINLKQMRLKVEFYKHHETQPFTSAFSDIILDTASKHLGALDFLDATPLKSCDTGGRKIIMISEFVLAVDVEPRFQLWDRNGTRQKHLEDDQEYIRQPMIDHRDLNETVAVFKESIIFITPSQPNLAKIRDKGLTIMLAARRKSDGFESRKKFLFSYSAHTEDCVYCNDNPDGVGHPGTGQAVLAPKREVPRPGRKKRRMSRSDADCDTNPAKYRHKSSPTSDEREEDPQNFANDRDDISESRSPSELPHNTISEMSLIPTICPPTTITTTTTSFSRVYTPPRTINSAEEFLRLCSRGNEAHPPKVEEKQEEMPVNLVKREKSLPLKLRFKKPSE